MGRERLGDRLLLGGASWRLGSPLSCLGFPGFYNLSEPPCLHLSNGLLSSALVALTDGHWALESTAIGQAELAAKITSVGAWSMEAALGGERTVAQAQGPRGCEGEPGQVPEVPAVCWPFLPWLQ